MDDLLGTKRVREFEKAKGDIRRALTEKYVEPHDRDLMGAELMRLGSFVAPSGLIGLGFGIILASRRRSRRNAALNVLLAHEKPVVVGFANGRTEPLPDLKPLLKRDPLGTIASYLLFSAGGFLVGALPGFVTGHYFVKKSFKRHPEAQARIQAAFRTINAEILRMEADWIDGRITAFHHLSKPEPEDSKR